MFNPYACRPIGSDIFFEHLRDCQARSYYDTELQETGYSLHGSTPWDNTPEYDGWAKLALAIMYGSFLDYLTYYQNRNRAEKEGDDKNYVYWNSKCLDLENRYFRRNHELEKIFDRMLRDVCWKGNNKIDKSRKALIGALGWTKDQRRK